MIENQVAILLKEINHLLTALEGLNSTASVNPDAIPIILQHGAFTPKRIVNWNYQGIAQRMENDPEYFGQLMAGFRALCKSEAPPSPGKYSLAEKKAVAFLVASRPDSRIVSKIHAALQMDDSTELKMLLAIREYTSIPEDLGEPFINLNRINELPFPQISILNPRFCTKFPLAAHFLTAASSDGGPASRSCLSAALEMLLKATDTQLDNYLVVAEYEFILKMAARFLPSDLLYEVILVPLWKSKNEHAASVVFKAFSENHDLHAFCVNELARLNKNAS